MKIGTLVLGQTSVQYRFDSYISTGRYYVSYERLACIILKGLYLIYTTVVCSITANYYIIVIGWQSIFLILLSYCIGYIYIYGVRYCTNVYWYYVTVWHLKVTVRYYFNTTCYYIRCGAIWRMILCYCWWTLLCLFSYYLPHSYSI